MFSISHKKRELVWACEEESKLYIFSPRMFSLAGVLLQTHAPHYKAAATRAGGDIASRQ